MDKTVFKEMPNHGLEFQTICFKMFTTKTKQSGRKETKCHQTKVVIFRKKRKRKQQQKPTGYCPGLSHSPVDEIALL